MINVPGFNINNLSSGSNSMGSATHPVTQSIQQANQNYRTQSYSSPGGAYPIAAGVPSGSVQGASTVRPSGGSSGGQSGGGSPQPAGPTSQMQGLLNSLGIAAQNTNDAAIRSVVDYYNGLQSQLEAQKPVLANAYQSAKSDVQNQLDTGNAQAQQQQDTELSNFNLAQGQLGQNYQNAQGTNREIARALGSFGTDYAQLQNRSSNDFMNQQNGLQGNYNASLTQIHQAQQALNTWGQNQMNSLANQYQSNIANIVNQENLTDTQKVDQVTQLKANLGQQLAQINNTVLNFQGQLAVAQQYAQAYSGQLGSANSAFTPGSYTNVFQGLMPVQAQGQGLKGSDITYNPQPTINNLPVQNQQGNTVQNQFGTLLG